MGSGEWLVGEIFPAPSPLEGEGWGEGYVVEGNPMITSIRLKNFKNFADETLRVGPFTLLVGANASGKSNIRDAFRFLHGIGRGYTLAEIMGGKREAGWKPIRGAMNEIVRFGQSSFSLEVGLKLEDGTAFRYSIESGRAMEIKDSATPQRSGPFRVMKEKLEAGLGTPVETVYTAQSSGAWLQVDDLWDKVDRPPLNADQPALTQKMWPRTAVRPFSDMTMLTMLLPSALTSMQFFELSPERMREPAFPGATVLGDSGENLPTVLEKICADPKRQETLTSWLQELTPMDVTGFKFPRDPSGRVHLVICEKDGREVSAYSASDGTLRFLAILAALLGDNAPDLYFFEEIDTGIHPARQWLLLELIEKQAAKRGIQVISTTHAPDLLTFVNDSTFEHLAVVGRLEDSDDAIIRRVAELPNAKKLRTSKGGLGRLLTGAWMEDMLAFTQDDNAAEGNGE